MVVFIGMVSDNDHIEHAWVFEWTSYQCFNLNLHVGVFAKRNSVSLGIMVMLS